MDSPRKPGQYIVKFFPERSGYVTTDQSNEIVIPNRDKLCMEIKYKDDRMKIEEIKLTWDIHSVDISFSDYIALYPIDAQNNYYMDYQYINSSGSITFNLRPAKPGVYEFRYHSHLLSKYEHIVSSQPWEIINNDTLEANIDEPNGQIIIKWEIGSHIVSSWDWIGIFETGQPNTKYIYSSYVLTTINQIRIPIMSIPPGSYEARYFSHSLGKYSDFLTSPFKIPSTFVISFPHLESFTN